MNIIRSLSVRKAHGHDNISIKMLKICDSAFVVEPLTESFESIQQLSKSKSVSSYLEKTENHPNSQKK